MRMHMKNCKTCFFLSSQHLWTHKFLDMLNIDQIPSTHWLQPSSALWLGPHDTSGQIMTLESKSFKSAFSSLAIACTLQEGKTGCHPFPPWSSRTVRHLRTDTLIIICEAAVKERTQLAILSGNWHITKDPQQFCFQENRRFTKIASVSWRKSVSHKKKRRHISGGTEWGKHVRVFCVVRSVNHSCRRSPSP